MRNKKIISRLCLIGIVLIILMNLIYFGFHTFMNKRYMDKYASSSEYLVTPIKTAKAKMEGDVCYSVLRTKWYSFNTNLAICDNETNTWLIIWTNIVKGGYKYGVSVSGDNGEVIGQIKLDENWKAKSSQEQKIIDEHQAEINKLRKMAYEEWGIGS